METDGIPMLNLIPLTRGKVYPMLGGSTGSVKQNFPGRGVFGRLDLLTYPRIIHTLKVISPITIATPKLLVQAERKLETLKKVSGVLEKVQYQYVICPQYTLYASISYTRCTPLGFTELDLKSGYVEWPHSRQHCVWRNRSFQEAHFPMELNWQGVYPSSGFSLE